MGKWKTELLSKHVFEKTQKNKDNRKLEVYSVTNHLGLVKSEEYFNKTVYSKNLSNYKIIEQNQIAYNPSRINVGSIAFCNDKSGLLSPIYVIFQCSKDLNPLFLIYHLKTVGGLNKIDHFSQKGVRHTLNFDNLIRMPISFPEDIEEQNDIVSFCDYLTEIKKKREKTIEILDDVILSSFIEMFGDPHENPKNWEFVDLKNKLLEDPQNGLYVNESMYGSGTPIARIDSFYGGILDEPEELKKVEISKKDLKLFGLNHNDIILSRTNSLIYLGKCALIEELSKTIVFESNMMRLKINPDKISPQFLIAYFLTNMARNHIAKRAKKAANQVSINQEDIMDMQIPDIPITAQQDFVKIVMKWFELKKKLRKDLTMLKDFINSTEFGLFSGKIELKEFKKSISL